MMRGKVAPSIMLALLLTCKQSVEVPHMSSPQDKQMREYKQKVKREHDTKIIEVEEHP